MKELIWVENMTLKEGGGGGEKIAYRVSFGKPKVNGIL